MAKIDKQALANEKLKAGVVTDMKDIGQLKGVVTQNGKAAGPKIRKLGPSKLVDNKVAEKIKETIEENVAMIATRITEVAEVLTSGADLSYRDDLRENLVEIAEFVVGEEVPSAKSQLTLALMSTMAEKFPANGVALNLIADIGLEIGFFHITRNEAEMQKTGRYVALPVTKESGRGWDGVKLTSGHPNCREILSVLKVKALASQDTRDAQQKADIEKLKVGVTDTLDGVLGKGTGEAICFIPSSQVGQKRYREGYLRVRARGGNLEVAGAAGGCEKIALKIMGEGVKIPIASVVEAGYRMPYIKDQDQATLTRVFRTLVQQGLQKLAAQDQLDELREKAKKTDWVNFVTKEDTVGVASLFLNYWKGTQKVSFYAERREDGKMAVVSYPPRLKALLGSCGTFTEPGKGYKGLPAPFGEMLLALHGIAVKRGAANVPTPTPKVEEKTETAVMADSGEEAKSEQSEG